MRVVLSTDARRDRREAEAYYQHESPRARVAFRRNLDAAMQYVVSYPLGAPVHTKDVRAKTLAHFPYTILYRVVGEHLFVLAIANQMRDPEHYDDRV